MPEKIAQIRQDFQPAERVKARLLSRRKLNPVFAPEFIVAYFLVIPFTNIAFICFESLGFSLESVWSRRL
ncbi:MAG: hypothetical protein BWY75_03868 [bacterium ADurb.Bin425]|nr:MAG: hypothetical protein BWY75_03868 [bacterium ADurb.Bin425]